MTASDPGAPTETKLRRSIGTGLLALYGVGVMIGAGIYVLVGEIAGQAGALTPLAFVVAGLVAGLSAWSFAALAARIPKSAGEAAYVRQAFGLEWLAALTGLAVAIVGTVSAAAILKGGVGYLGAWVTWPAPPLEIAIGMLLGLVALAGVVESLTFAAVLTVVEVLGLIVVAFVGLSAPPVMAWESMLAPDLSQEALLVVLGAAGLAFFAFIGFEDMVNIAEEVVAPERTMPKAIFLAVVLTTVIYMAVAIAAIRAVPTDVLGASPRPLLDVAEAGGAGQMALGLLAGVAVLATLNGVLAQIVMAARVLYGLGADVPALAWARQVSAGGRVPARATIAITVAVISLALVAPIALLAEWTTSILLGIFVVVNVALLVLRRQPAPPGVSDPPIWVPVLAIVTAVGLLAA